jgi:hypothetical protein
MPPDLKPSEALSQVVFVDDYCQLVFQAEIFNVYNFEFRGLNNLLVIEQNA